MTPLKVESTLTDRFQTTVPAMVRNALHLGKRDRINYTIRPDGVVLLSRAEMTEANDPVLDMYLTLLAHDISTNTSRVKPFDARLAKRIQSLVKGMEVDLDQPLPADEE